MATEMLRGPLEQGVPQAHELERRMDVVWREETPPNLAHIGGAGPRGQVGKFVFSTFLCPLCPPSSSLSPTLLEHLGNLHLAPELGSVL